MTTTHAAQTLFAGDKWEIRGTLYDVNNTPFNLTGVTVEWALLDEAREVVLRGADVSVVITDVALGKCTITVPLAKTATLPAGRYSDVCRISIGDLAATMWVGPIQVAENPFNAA